MTVYSVTQLTRYIKALLDEDAVLCDCAVEGEVSNSKLASSGHYYFTLKDEDAELKCVMWRSQVRRVRIPSQGARVRVQGYISVYERGGAYQLYAADLVSLGDGRLWQDFLALRERLRAEGLFDEEIKRPLPAWPRRIGVVTSPTAAALQDILNVLGARFPLVEVVLAPTLVQGSEAPAAICRALAGCGQDGGLDLVIVARGGGSIEDLWAFNDEAVARAIRNCPVPVIAGVGHETDFTIADFVADLRAPTPSAAAAAAVPDIVEVTAGLEMLAERLEELAEERLDAHRERLLGVERLLEQRSPHRRILELAQRVDELAHRGGVAVDHTCRLLRLGTEAAQARLQALDPRLVLGRGYAIVTDPVSGQVLRRATQTAIGRDVAVRLHEGELAARVQEIVPQNRDTDGGQG
ncbi:MAG: exodeoxyribonuclease VII large subunit [Chloroflexi bacterium]|nr:exodeoxyribonuclease VII large subunit [Chloroflexota bacterium]